MIQEEDETRKRNEGRAEWGRRKASKQFGKVEESMEGEKGNCQANKGFSSLQLSKISLCFPRPDITLGIILYISS